MPRQATKPPTWTTKSYSLHSRLRDRDPSMRMTVDEFREWLLGQRRRPGDDLLWECRYCQDIVGLGGVSVDHMHPLKLGGPSAPVNFAECCRRCNTAKGIIGAPQFTALVALAKTWPAPMRTYLFRQLQSMPANWDRARRTAAEKRKGFKALAVARNGPGAVEIKKSRRSNHHETDNHCGTAVDAERMQLDL